MLVSVRLGTGMDFIARLFFLLFSFFFSSGSLKQGGRGSEYKVSQET
jgi:hypothetical protein